MSVLVVNVRSDVDSTHTQNALQHDVDDAYDDDEREKGSNMLFKFFRFSFFFIFILCAV